MWIKLTEESAKKYFNLHKTDIITAIDSNQFPKGQKIAGKYQIEIEDAEENSPEILKQKEEDLIRREQALEQALSEFTTKSSAITAKENELSIRISAVTTRESEVTLKETEIKKYKQSVETELAKRIEICKESNDKEAKRLLELNEKLQSSIKKYEQSTTWIKSYQNYFKSARRKIMGLIEHYQSDRSSPIAVWLKPEYGVRLDEVNRILWNIESNLENLNKYIKPIVMDNEPDEEVNEEKIMEAK